MPCCRFLLPTYPSVGFAASGPYWSLLAVWPGLNPPGTSGAGLCLPGASWGLLELYFDSSPMSPHKYKAKHATKLSTTKTLKQITEETRGEINNQTRQSKTKITITRTEKRKQINKQNNKKNPLSSNPFAVLVLSDVPFGQKKIRRVYH